MADAGIGEAAAAEGAKGAGEAAGAEAAGAAAAGDAAAGGALGTLGAGAGTATATGLGEIGSTAGMLGASEAFDAGTALSGTALSGANAAGAGALSASAPFLSGTSAAGAGLAGGEALTSSVPYLPGVTDSTSAFVNGAANTAAADTGAGGAFSSYLPVTSSAAPLSTDLASSFGLPASGDLAALNTAASSLPASTFPTGVDAVGSSGLGGIAGNFSDWASKNPLQAAMLGLSGFNALSAPKIPSAAGHALDNANAMTDEARQVISSGGTSSPAWQQAKSSIDQRINEYVKNTAAQIKQNAVNSGMGGENSMVVREQLNNLQQQAETQRQQLYQQELSQIVSQSVSELTGGNQTLSSIAQMQLGQSNEAKQAASQTAQLAIMLGQLSKSPSAVGGS